METMTEATAPASQRRLGRHIASAAVAVVLSIAAIGSASGSASALTGTSTYNPGGTINDKAGGYERLIIDAGRTIMEAPNYANQQQQVCITTTLWQVVPAGYGTGASPFWKAAQKHTRCGWISAAQTSIRDNGVYFNVNGGPFYSLSADVRWYSSTGALLAASFIDYDRSGDYVCFQGVWRCSVGTVNWGARDAFITFQ